MNKSNKCYFCITGILKRQKIDIIRYWGKEVIALKNVPALVCQQCGEKYFTARTSHKIDKKIQEVLKAKTSFEEIRVPVASL